MPASEPSKMEDRPPIDSIVYISAEGNPHTIIVGRGDVTEIRETQECGEFCYIPWVEVWAGESLTERFVQHKLEHIFYRRTQ